MATSRSFQTQRNWKIEKRGERREAQRQHHAGEDLEVAGAVDARRFHDLLGQAGHVVAQEIDGERQAEGGVREPDAEIGLAVLGAEGVARCRCTCESSGISDICSGTTSRPTTTATMRPRNGNRIQASA